MKLTGQEAQQVVWDDHDDWECVSGPHIDSHDRWTVGHNGVYLNKPTQKPT